MEVICFISGKGGVGKSTLSANVAAALHQAGKRVLAIDLDPQNNLRLHLGMDVQDATGMVREGLQPGALFTAPSGVHFVPFGQASSGDLQEFAGFLRRHPHWLEYGLRALSPLGFDYVVLDTPPGPSVYLQQALAASTRALTVILSDAASYATVAHIDALVARHTADNPRFKGMHVVLNQMPLKGQLAHRVREALASDPSIQLAPVSIHRDPRVGMAFANQETLSTYAPTSMVNADVQYLIDWLLDVTG